MRLLRVLPGSLGEALWETRRRLYARGILRGTRVPTRVVSVGNLTTGGAGKTTLVLHLAKLALERGIAAAVVCRRYRPGPGGFGDEEQLLRQTLGSDRVFVGARKRDAAAAAAGVGAALVLVDDGFSHWALERDLDIVLLDSQNLWGGGRLLPAGRVREPRRALQRADVVVISRLARNEDPGRWIAEARRYGPAAHFAAGRHAAAAVRGLDGGPVEGARRVRVVTGTGNPRAVARTAEETGLEVVAMSAYRDHHWFSAEEARAEARAAGRDSADVLLTAKDAVRWPAARVDARVVVMTAEWRWVCGGEVVERLALEEEADA